MIKPKNFDNTNSGTFTPVELGGHHAIIKAVKETKSKTGKDMIVVAFDFAVNDKQPLYFSKAFENDVRPEKKWPHQGTKYVLVQAWDSDDCSRDFKSFCEAAEKSNGFRIDWDKDFGSQFKGKKIGVVFGNVENEYNGKVTTRPEVRWFCSDEKVETMKVPDLKPLKGKSGGSFGGGFGNTNGFTSAHNIADVEVPF